MKRFTVFPKQLALLPLLVLLASCGEDEKKEDPTPTHKLQVKVQGTNLGPQSTTTNGLGAYYEMKVKHADGSDVLQFLGNLWDNEYRDTDPFEVVKTDIGYLELGFRNIRANNFIRPVATTNITATILIDGKIVKTVVADRTTPIDAECMRVKVDLPVE